MRTLLPGEGNFSLFLASLTFLLDHRCHAETNTHLQLQANQQNFPVPPLPQGDDRLDVKSGQKGHKFVHGTF